MFYISQPMFASATHSLFNQLYFCPLRQWNENRPPACITYLSCSYCRQSSRDEKGYGMLIYNECLPMLPALDTCDLAFIVIVAHCESLRCSMGKAYTLWLELYCSI